MDAIALHLELRNAIALSDELCRYEQAMGNNDLAGRLASVRTALGELEREVGRSHEERITPRPSLIERIQRGLEELRSRLEEIPVNLRPRLGQLMVSLERIVFAELRPTTPVPAKPVLGVLPLRRAVPQPAHTVVDYLAATACFLSARLARTRRARVVGLLLGTKLGGSALLTDVRFSAAKWIPIELHEVIDHAAGATAVLAPFVLGYRKKDPVAATIQVVAGLGTILASLFTDYRAATGVARAIRSRGGRHVRRWRGERVSEVQRPLEGLANPSVLPRLDV